MAGHVSATTRAEAPAERLAPADGVRAAFTGRAFGNTSLVAGGGDPAAARRALGPLAGAAPERAVFMEQVHGPGVARVSAADAGRGLRRQDNAVPGVDALLTTEPGVALVVLTADCVPVLLAGGGVVAAAHAGRAGLLAGVIERTVQAMAQAGAAAAAVTAIVGPAIGACCYEVPAGMAAEAGRARPELSGRTTWGTPSLDLPAGAAAALRRAGVGRVGVLDACTRCAPDRWFSHRAATDGRLPAAEQGRQASVIALAGEDAPGETPSLRSPMRWLS